MNTDTIMEITPMVKPQKQIDSCHLRCKLLVSVVLVSSVILLSHGAQAAPFQEARSAGQERTLSSEASQPVPTAKSSTSSQNIKIAEGDLIEINVLDAPELSGKFRVSDSGDITLILGGGVHVAGESVSTAASRIEKSLRDGQFILNPHVTVFVDEYANQGITVFGEVKTPGSFPLFGPHTLYDAIAAAGGLTPAASNEVTIMHRKSSESPQIVQLSNSLRIIGTSDVPIEPGDKIFVASAGIIYVTGEVARPGGFVVSRTEASYSVTKLISLAQGITHTGKLDNSVIIRRTNDGIVQYPVRVKQILKNKDVDITLVPGDVLYIPSSTAKLIGYRSLEAIFATTSGLAINGRF